MQQTTAKRATRRWHLGIIAWALLALGAASAGCSGDDPYYGPGPYDGYNEDCRFDPLHCGGGLGGVCDRDSDCASGYCCTEDSNCGGGMCTLPCDRDVDCPSYMACEHHVCFFRCDRDSDCANGQTCEHNNTICEWP